MRKSLSIVAGLALAAASLSAAPLAQATGVGNEGCSHGFWKTHPSAWSESPTEPIPTTSLVRNSYKVSATFKDATFMDALEYRGSNPEGILLRNAVASWLNAASESIGYPYRRFTEPFNLVAKVNAAIASGDRLTMLDLERILNKANTELGCPLETKPVAPPVTSPVTSPAPNPSPGANPSTNTSTTTGNIPVSSPSPAPNAGAPAGQPSAGTPSGNPAPSTTSAPGSVKKNTPPKKSKNTGKKTSGKKSTGKKGKKKSGRNLAKRR